MTTRELVIVLTTAPDAARAESWARLFVDERLAACVNVHAPMVSVYRWKGAVERDEECQMMIKTARDCVPALEVRLRELHPYELPEFLLLRVDGGSQRYLEWVAASTSATSPNGGV